MKRILVIEDDQLLRDTIREILVNEGFDVVDAQNGKTGLRIYEEVKIDLIITDILMPEKDGFEVLLDLKRRNDSSPAIAISGGGDISADEYLYIADKLGCFATLTKPFDNAELVQKVNAALKL